MKKLKKMSKLNSKILKILTLIFFTSLFLLLPANNSKALTPLLQDTNTTYNEEKIYDYHSKIIVNKDSSLDVTEEITVYAGNIEINHGIYRDFPTIYKGPYGLREKVGFEILDIQKQSLGTNGLQQSSIETEPYHTASADNGVRIYIGSENHILSKGFYKYFIHYKTTYQIADLQDTDQLYYNITGNGWDFSIDKASAEIVLPTNYAPSSVDIKLFQGPQNSNETSSNYSISTKDNKSIITISSSRNLASKEGFTAKINFPKGDISYPYGYTGPVRLAKDNLDLIVLILALLFLSVYCVWAWFSFGIDPKKKPIFPRFTPPDGFSPAGINYLLQKSYGNKSFSAAIINLGVKGYLKIHEEEGGFSIFKTKKYSLEKLKEATDGLPSEEKLILNRLFTYNSKTYQFPTSYDAHTASVVTEFQNKVKDKYFSKFYKFNVKYIVFAWMIAVFGGVLGFLISGFDFNYISTLVSAIIIGIVIFSFGIVLTSTSNIYLKIFSGCAIFIFFVPTAIGFIGFDLFTGNSGLYPTLLISSSAIIAGIFTILIQKPTEDGQKIIEEIEGFKMYLSTAEENDVKLMNKEMPENLDLFQKYLPYAVAFSVETQWTKRFENQIAEAQKDPSSANYAAWYIGTSSFNSASSIGSLTSSISSAISSASTSSSSSGGSSGGGGGGGGGGGW